MCFYPFQIFNQRTVQGKQPTVLLRQHFNQKRAEHFSLVVDMSRNGTVNSIQNVQFNAGTLIFIHHYLYWSIFALSNIRGMRCSTALFTSSAALRAFLVCSPRTLKVFHKYMKATTNLSAKVSFSARVCLVFALVWMLEWHIKHHPVEYCILNTPHKTVTAFLVIWAFMSLL